MKKIFLVLWMGCYAAAGWGQDSTWVAYRALSLELGTGGLGVAYLKDWPAGYTMQAGLRWIAYQKPQQVHLDNASVMDIDPDISRLSLGLTIQKSIFRPWLQLEGGGDIYLVSKQQMWISTETGLDSEGLQIAADDFGVVQFGIDWWKVQPYLGIRFGGQGRDKKVAVAGLLGCWYMGSPKLNVGYSGFLETTNLSNDIKVIEQNMKHYSFYPRLVVQFILQQPR